MKLKQLSITVFQQRKGLVKFYGTVVILGIFFIVTRKLLHFRQGYTFLLWNFFLAVIPLVISSFMLEMNRLKYKNRTLLITGFFWLLFLPNAPYMLSDYKYLWFDHEWFINPNILTLSWFILPALFTAVISLNDISGILKTRMNHQKVRITIFLICMMTGFGVYVGNTLRLNSWDILHKPLHVMGQVANTFVHPVQNLNAWIITFGYGMIFYLLYQVFTLVGREFTQVEK